METGLNFGHSITKEAVGSLSKGVIDILKVGRQTGADQATILKALAILESSFSLNNASISDCNIQGETTVNKYYNNEEEENED